MRACWTLSASAVTASQMKLNEDIPSWATRPNHGGVGGGVREMGLKLSITFTCPSKKQ